MSTIFFDQPFSDQERRAALYRGSIFVYSPCGATTQLSKLAKEMLIAAFEPYDPRTIDRHLSMEECAGILTSLRADPQSC